LQIAGHGIGSGDLVNDRRKLSFVINLRAG